MSRMALSPAVECSDHDSLHFNCLCRPLSDERWANELGGPRMNTGLRSPRKGVRCLFAVEMDLIASLGPTAMTTFSDLYTVPDSWT